MIKRIMAALAAITIIVPFTTQNYPITTVAETDPENVNIFEDYYYELDGTFDWIIRYLEDNYITSEIDNYDYYVANIPKGVYNGIEYIEVFDSVSYPDEESKHIVIGHIQRKAGLDVVIPSEINGLPVTGYFDNTGSMPQIRSITLPETITVLENTFYHYPKLEKVTLSSKAERIDQSFFFCENLKEVIFTDSTEPNDDSYMYLTMYESFQHCHDLKEIELPDTIYSIGSCCFQDSGLTSLTIPDSVYSVGSFCCNGCRDLTEVKLGSNVESIGNNAFSYTAITSVDIPASVMMIGDGYGLPFVGCEYLSDVNIAEENEYYFDSDGIPFEKKCIYHDDEGTCKIETNVILFIPFGKSGEVVFPDSYDAYDQLYIGKNTNITSFSVNDTNEKYKAVDGCIYTKDGKELVLVPSTVSGEFIIPETVERLGRAFQNVHLDKLVISSKVSKIGYYSLTGHIGELVINSDNININYNDDCFYDFGGYTSQHYYERMFKAIEYDSDDEYEDIDWLQLYKLYIGNKELELPGNCIFDGKGLVSEKNKLCKLSFRSGERVEIKSMPDCSIINELEFSPDIDELYIHAGADFEEIVLPKGHTVIDNSVFSKCANLKSLYIMGSADIGKDSFSKCRNLCEVTIDGTSKIDKKAFASDDALKVVNLKQKSEIYDLAFEECTALTDLNISLDSELYDDSFKSCISLMNINGIEAVEEGGSEFAPALDDFIRKNFARSTRTGFIDRWILNKAAQIVADVTDEDMSEAAKAKALHDWICDNTVYEFNDNNEPENHIDSSVFLDGIAVCEGYARTYNLLLHAAGIETCYVKTKDHGWNIAKIGGKNFHIDTTWDDLMHSYQWFMVSDAEILQPKGTHYNWNLLMPSNLHNFQSKTMPFCQTAMGDMDGDGVFTQSDIRTLSSYISGKGEYIIEADLDYNGKVDSSDITAGYKKLSITMGDVNEDGEVGLADALSILQYVANSQKYQLSETALRNADVYDNGDGITAMDALAIQKKDARLVSNLPCSYIVDGKRISVE